MSDPTTDRTPNSTPEVLTPREASQGRKGTGVLRILIISLVLVVIVLFGLFALHGTQLSTNHGAGGQSGIVSHAQANSFHAPEPAPKPNVANGTANSSN